MKGADIEASGSIQFLQSVQDLRIFRGQGAERLNAGPAQVNFSAAVIVDAGVPAQTEGVDIEPFDGSCGIPYENAA